MKILLEVDHQRGYIVRRAHNQRLCTKPLGNIQKVSAVAQDDLGHVVVLDHVEDSVRGQHQVLVVRLDGLLDDLGLAGDVRLQRDVADRSVWWVE